MLFSQRKNPKKAINKKQYFGSNLYLEIISEKKSFLKVDWFSSALKKADLIWPLEIHEIKKEFVEKERISGVMSLKIDEFSKKENTWKCLRDFAWNR